MEQEFIFDPLYMVAVMKVQHELGGGRFRGFQSMFERALADLGIAPDEFDLYFDSHRDDLRRIVEAVGV